MLAGRRGDVSVKELCRQHQIAETLYYSWREKLLAGGRQALAGKDESPDEHELRAVVRVRGGRPRRSSDRRDQRQELAPSWVAWSAVDKDHCG